MNFQRADLEELLKKHSAISALDLCLMHWIPEDEELEWYLGFLQATEIHRGIRELFAQDVQPQAYEALANRIREVLDDLVRQAILSEQDENSDRNHDSNSN